MVCEGSVFREWDFASGAVAVCIAHGPARSAPPPRPPMGARRVGDASVGSRRRHRRSGGRLPMETDLAIDRPQTSSPTFA